MKPVVGLTRISVDMLMAGFVGVVQGKGLVEYFKEFDSLLGHHDAVP